MRCRSAIVIVARDQHGRFSPKSKSLQDEIKCQEDMTARGPSFFVHEDGVRREGYTHSMLRVQIILEKKELCKTNANDGSTKAKPVVTAEHRRGR